MGLNPNMSNFYKLSAKTLSGQVLDFSTLKDKTVLVVNTASHCGLTPQFSQLETLYKQYKDNGLVILGFPSNTFKQEKVTGEEISEFCSRNYGVSFTMMEKCDVNGSEESPVYTWLKAQTEKPDPGWIQRNLAWAMNFAPGPRDISWNFEKFLVDKDGKVAHRFPPKMAPVEFEDQIKSDVALIKINATNLFTIINFKLMGYIKHHTIVVTAWNEEKIKDGLKNEVLEK